MALFMATGTVSNRAISIVTGTLNGEAGADGYVFVRLTVLLRKTKYKRLL